MFRKQLLARSQLHSLCLVLATVFSFKMTPVSLAVGLSVFAAGIVLQLWSKSVLVRNVELCTGGPYAICRHPFYLANAVFDLGLLVMSGAYHLLAVYPPAFYLAYWHVIREEDARLAAGFGADHAGYSLSAGAILPRVWRLAGRWRAPVSLRNLLAEREVSRLCRHAGYPLVVVLAARLWQTWWTPQPPWNAPNFILLGCILALTLMAQLVRRWERQGPQPQPDGQGQG